MILLHLSVKNGENFSSIGSQLVGSFQGQHISYTVVSFAKSRFWPYDVLLIMKGWAKDFVFSSVRLIESLN